jgi:hypothetical protein
VFSAKACRHTSINVSSSEDRLPSFCRFSISSVSLWDAIVFLSEFRVDFHHDFLGHRDPVGYCSFNAGTGLVVLSQLAHGQYRRANPQNAFAAFIHAERIA